MDTDITSGAELIYDFEKENKMINRTTVKMLRSEIQDALVSLGEKHGLEFNVGGASFSSNNVRFKVDANVIGDDGEAFSQEAEDFGSLASMYGFEPEDLGKEFSYGGETYKITGLKPRRRKYPVSAEGIRNGKGYKFPADMVKAALKMSSTPT